MLHMIAYKVFKMHTDFQPKCKCMSVRMDLLILQHGTYTLFCCLFVPVYYYRHLPRVGKVVALRQATPMLPQDHSLIPQG